jgi:hypothetical protein
MSTRKAHATPAERNSAKTAAYQQRHAAKGLCRLCPRRRAKGDDRFCQEHRHTERERDRERKRAARPVIARPVIARPARQAVPPDNGTRARRDRRA